MPKAARDWMRIFHPRKSTNAQNSGDSGFTLIELLVVVALIALMAWTTMPKVSSYFRLSLNSATREIATTVREAYNSAVMTGNVHRLVYDLDAAEYWVEVGPPTLLLATEESTELDEARARFKNEEEKDSEKPQFQMDKTITRKKKALPRGARFKEVISEQSLEAIIEGKAYTHFFPHGLSEQTIIYLEDDSENGISLIISPIVGKTTLLNGHLSKEEIFNED